MKVRQKLKEGKEGGMELESSRFRGTNIRNTGKDRAVTGVAEKHKYQAQQHPLGDSLVFLPPISSSTHYFSDPPDPYVLSYKNKLESSPSISFPEARPNLGK